MFEPDLPEPQSKAVPLIALLFGGLVLVFFFGLVWMMLDRPKADPLASTPKEPEDLLGPGDVFQVQFETTVGPFVVEIYPEWAPRGATQFKELVENHFFNQSRFFRVVPNFVAQFGIHADPVTHGDWQTPIPDEDVKHPNEKYTLTFAKSGPNTRSRQMFFNLNDNPHLDKDFPPIGKVIQGMENLDKINAEYRETPDQQQIVEQGNPYLDKNFPNLDYIKTASLIKKPSKSEEWKPAIAEKPKSRD